MKVLKNQIYKVIVALLFFQSSLALASANTSDLNVQLIEAIEAGQANRVKALIAEGADPNYKDTLIGDTPLHYAVWDGYLQIVEILLANEVDPNAKNNFEKTPLHYVVMKGAFLPSRKDFDPGLHSALWSRYKDIIEALIAGGADPNSKDNLGTTPLYLAMSIGDKALILIENLIAGGADPDSKDKWNGTPLHSAAYLGHTGSVKILLANDADPNVKNDWNETPLHLLARGEQDNQEIAEALIAEGVELNIKDTYGETPLHKATKRNNENIAEVLIDYGADTNILNNEGQTALEIATIKGHESFVQFLRSKGVQK